MQPSPNYILKKKNRKILQSKLQQFYSTIINKYEKHKIIPSINNPTASLIYLYLWKMMKIAKSKEITVEEKNISELIGIDEEQIYSELMYLTKLKLIDIIPKSKNLIMNTNWTFEEEIEC